MKRGSLFSLDIPILVSVILLVVIGILFIYSSNTDADGTIKKDEFVRQIFWAVLGLVLLFVFSFLNYLHLRDYALVIYLVLLGGLVVTLLVNLVINPDSRRPSSWLGIGGIGIQPSEFAKLATILFLGSFLSRIGARIRELPYFLLAFLICLVPMLLILLQPDMGTALVFIPILVAMTWVAGTKRRYIVFLLLTGLFMIFFSIQPELSKYFHLFALPFFKIMSVTNYLLIAAGVVFLIGLLAALGYYIFREPYYYWIMYGAGVAVLSSLGGLIGRVMLAGYQVMRLIIFLDPYIDRKGEGYNIIQSITAVGSGGLFGRGFRNGTMSQLKYVPVQSNDFIFSIIAEEWGFIGGLLVFGLFVILLYRSLRILKNTADSYAQYVGVGIIGMIFYHCVINIGMNMGLMPITGIPLFFVSYGGSALLTGLMSVGIILNIYFRRYASS